MATQTYLRQAVLAHKRDRAAGCLCRCRCVRTCRLARARSQRCLVHRRRGTSRYRNHRCRRHKVVNRDRQRRVLQVTITVLQRVREHIRVATCRARITLVLVRAIGLHRQLAVGALHRCCHRGRIVQIRIRSTLGHTCHHGTIGTLGVIGPHVARDLRIAAAGHRVRVNYRTRHIVHDIDHQLARRSRIVVLVLHHYIKAHAVRIHQRVVQQCVRVVDHACSRDRVVCVVALELAL